jgi:hypothetical protein
MNQRGFIVQIIIAAIVVVALGAGAAVYFTRQPAPASSKESEEEMMNEAGMTSDSADEAMRLDQQLQPETEIGSFTGTVTDLLKQRQNLTCTFSQADVGGTTSGTVYIAGQGQRIRGDFVLTQPEGTTMNGHIVRDGAYNYFWSDQLEQGTKTPIDEREEAVPTEKNDQEVLDDSFEYNCQRWPVDTAMFALPPDKEFVDLTQQIQQINTATGQVQQEQCSACDQLQGADQAQCRAALGC